MTEHFDYLLLPQTFEGKTDEWLALPDLFRDWDLLLWNVRQHKPIFVKGMEQKSILILAFDLGQRIKRGESIFAVDTLRSVYLKARTLDDILADPAYILVKKKNR